MTLTAFVLIAVPAGFGAFASAALLVTVLVEDKPFENMMALSGLVALVIVFVLCVAITYLTWRLLKWAFPLPTVAADDDRGARA
jgi:hypothetical protein